MMEKNSLSEFSIRVSDPIPEIEFDLHKSIKLWQTPNHR
jgi:hypothetical protein